MIGAALGEQYPVVTCKARQERSSSTDQAWPTEGICKSGKLWFDNPSEERRSVSFLFATALDKPQCGMRWMEGTRTNDGDAMGV